MGGPIDEQPKAIRPSKFFEVGGMIKLEKDKFIKDFIMSEYFTYNVRTFISMIKMHVMLTLKMPRKPASENFVCSCRLLNILANFSNLFLHTGKQCGP